MRLLILGCDGFIGSHLIKKLVKDSQHDVIGFDKSDEKFRNFIREKNAENFEYIQGDIRTDEGVIEEEIKRSDIIIDLIAHANPNIYIERPLDVVQLNFFENLKVVNYCEEHNKRLIQFSSCEVYGKTGGNRKAKKFEVGETDLILGPVEKHRWIYSCAKQLLERIIHAKGLEDRLEYTIIRPFNFVGPEIDYLIKNEEEGCPRVPAQFISCLLYGRSLKLVDGGKNYRSYVYIDDAIRAIRRIIDNNNKIFTNEIVNIGAPSNETKIKDLAYLMIEIYEQLTDKKFEYGVENISSENFYGEGYEDCDRRIPDIKKLKSIGWEPNYDTREAMKKTLKYYLKKYS